MFTSVESVLLKIMHHLAAKLLTTYNILKLKISYDKLWVKFRPERKAILLNEVPSNNSLVRLDKRHIQLCHTVYVVIKNKL